MAANWNLYVPVIPIAYIPDEVTGMSNARVMSGYLTFFANIFSLGFAFQLSTSSSVFCEILDWIGD